MDEQQRRTLPGGLPRSQDVTAQGAPSASTALAMLEKQAPVDERFRRWETGDLIDHRYEIRSSLGEGGFGQVLAAYDQRMQREVAIKTLRPDRSADIHYAKRFAREIKLVSALSHPNTVRVYDTGIARDETPYLVMELLDGESLETALRRRGSFSTLAVAKIAQQVLKSLFEAHSRGIIHRDLKPANLFLVDLPGEPDFVKVLDFGIAKAIWGGDETLTGDGQPGTGKYMSPERLRGNLVPSTDIYSLGVVMIELIEGRHPYEGREGPAELHHLEEREPVPMHGSASTLLGPVIRRAVEKSARKRFETAREMLDSIEEVLPEIRRSDTDGIRETRPLEREAWSSEPTAPSRNPPMIIATGDPFSAQLPSSLDARGLASAMRQSRKEHNDGRARDPRSPPTRDVSSSQTEAEATITHVADRGAPETELNVPHDKTRENANSASAGPTAKERAAKDSQQTLRRLVLVLGGALFVVVVLLIWVLIAKP